MVYRLYRRVACVFLAMTTAAAVMLPAKATTVYFDVSPDNWYYSAVEYGVTTGLLGETVRYFHPSSPTSRASFYTILYRAAGSPAAKAILPPDVSAACWYAPAVRWAVASGLMDPEIPMRPNDSMTRAEVCLALLRYDKTMDNHHLPAAAPARFTDLNGLPPEQQAAISVCRAAGIVQGDSPVCFGPQELVTRAELMTMMQKYFVHKGCSTLPRLREGLLDLSSCKGWSGKVQLDFPLSAVNSVTAELVISLNQRILQENTPRSMASYGHTIDGNQKHLTNYGNDGIYDCHNTETILYNAKDRVDAGTALLGKQSYYGYALQVSDTTTQDPWHKLAQETGKDPWQCTWWAWGRAAQYLDLAYGQSLAALCDGMTILGNGGDYYRNLSRYFANSRTTPKANAIVSWSGGQYGHVGYVEAVDEKGIWVSMADAGHAWRGITYIPKSSNPNNPYPLYWYGNEQCNGFNYLDHPLK